MKPKTERRVIIGRGYGYHHKVAHASFGTVHTVHFYKKDFGAGMGEYRLILEKITAIPRAKARRK